MIEVLGDGSLIDPGSLGVGGAFGAGVVVALQFVRQYLHNGKETQAKRDDLRFIVDQAAKRDERIVESLNRLNQSQARMATLLDVLVQKTCGAGPATGVTA